MTSSEKNKLEIIFTEALKQVSSQDRDAFIDKACAGDGELKKQVTRLVGAHKEAGDFLETPPVDPDALCEIQTPEEVPGARIGRTVTTR